MKLQVGVKIFLRNQEGKYLLLKRNLDTYTTIQTPWDIVGGRIDPGDGLEINLAREIHEETQLTLVANPTLVYAQDIIIPNEKHVVRLTYVGEAHGDIVLDTTENGEYAWMSVDDMLHLDGLDRYAREVVERKGHLLRSPL